MWCYCICGGREKDITKDSQQKDENRLGKVCFRHIRQERVKLPLLCKLFAGCPSFAFQINCACFCRYNAVASLSVSGKQIFIIAYGQETTERSKKVNEIKFTDKHCVVTFYS